MWPKAGDTSRDARRHPGADGGLIGWRRRQLQRAGFEADLAARVAADRSMDVHALLELVDLGCPPDLAARILAPLEPAADVRGFVESVKSPADEPRCPC